MAWAAVVVWAYLSLEAHLFFVYRRSKKKCARRLQSSASPPPEVSADVVRQLQVMPRIRTFYRDLFGASDHKEIKYGNIEKLFMNTIGATSQALIKYMIRLAERQINHTFEEGYNDSLQHTYCKEDNVIRGRYMPALLTMSLLSIKLVSDCFMRRHYRRVSTPHVVYWIHDVGRKREAKRVLLFMCGIGIGPITYFNLIQQFRDVYDVIIIVEIKWISFHITADPVADNVLIQDIASYVYDYMHKIHRAAATAASDSRGAPPCDLMMHSGGALYFRRLIKKLNFANKVLIEPACFLGGSSTATLQLYTYNTWNPLFQFPLVKNLPKLLDIAECVLQTDTPMHNTFLILSQEDSLFNPIPCAQFMASFHPDVEIYFIEKSGHGDAVAAHHQQTAALIMKKLGYLACNSKFRRKDI